MEKNENSVRVSEVIKPINSIRDVIPQSTIEFIYRVQSVTSSLDDIINQRKRRVIQLEAASTAAYEYLRSGLNEISNADENRHLLILGIEKSIETMDKQIAKYEFELNQMANLVAHHYKIFVE